ncbi:MAG: tetratricopeptide repeat protein, partial [Armatimonadetes bacterium]|nr:tetratricopeptide repeat protein [Armatimonadota bacterium]
MRRGASALLGIALTVAACLAAPTDIDRALAELRAGRAASAERMLAEVLKRNPDDLVARFWLGRALMDQGRVQQAAEHWREVIKRKPSSIDSRYWLGTALVELGELDAAREQFEALLKLDPNHKSAREALAQLAARRQSTGLAFPTKETRPPHHRIWLDLSGAGLDPGEVDVLSRNVLDYTFSSAPTDWYVASGLWGTTNRWTCSPQWSWFGGMAELGPAAVWCKHVFEGDIVVDAYVAFGMLYGYPRSYKNPGDLNITICGDGASLFSGYTFVFGGWQNDRTAILKNGRVIAENFDVIAPVFEDGYPGTYEFHRKWWNIRARKVGNRLQLFVDEKLACEATDPSPLSVGRVALWTYDNRIIIARTRIYYERLSGSPSPLPPERWAVPIVTVSTDGPVPKLSVSTVIASDFEYSVEPLSPRKESFAQVTLAAPGAGGSGRCAKVVNSGPGGT